MDFTDHIIIRYGEITLKKRNRKEFTKQLEKNIINALISFPTVKLETRFERMILALNGACPQEVIAKLKAVFGIHSLMPALKVAKDMHLIKHTAVNLLRQLSKPVHKFKVETKRVDKQFPLDSYACSRELGSHLLANFANLQVDVHNPDIVVNLLISFECAYLYGEVIPAAKGLPIGTSAKSLLLLSGGIDSAVAGYMTMRRGVEIECIHFASPPYTSEQAKQKVIDLATLLMKGCDPIVLHIVPFTNIQTEIYQKIPNKYNMTIMRRVMLRIADRLCKERSALAITTGDNLGQVASQTMESMFTINAVTNRLILRPLISMDKEEIIAIAREIGTYDISIRPYEDCCTVFRAYNPALKPEINKVEKLEKLLNLDGLISESLANIECIFLSAKTTESHELADLL